MRSHRSIFTGVCPADRGLQFCVVPVIQANALFVTDPYADSSASTSVNTYTSPTSRPHPSFHN